jgi:hypothetical protein
MYIWTMDISTMYMSLNEWSSEIHMLDFGVVKCDLFYSREPWAVIVHENAPWKEN